jgi:hypothetical protein
MDHIYILKCQDAIKIGYSSDVDKRIKNHQTSNPFIEFITKYEAPKWAEKYIHKKLNIHLKYGCTEWFNYFDGIYSEIDDLIEEVNIEKEKRLHKQELINKKIEDPVKVYHLKDENRADYAFVAAKNLARAFKIIAYISPIRPIFVKEINKDEYVDVIDNTEYVLKSSLRTKLELDFCKSYSIDFYKEYGITINRIKRLTTNDSFIVSQSLWDKPMKKVYAKEFKNAKSGRRKRKFK